MTTPFATDVAIFGLNGVHATPPPVAFVKKDSSVKALRDGFPGLAGEAMTQWLRLVDKGRSQGVVNTIYRIHTVGGSKPKICRGKPQHFEVPYVALY